MSGAGGVIEGLRQKTLEKSAARFGLVLVHCWNLGEKIGPYPLAENQGMTETNSDWVIVAGKIIADKIAPVLVGAREIGIPVFHLASGSYAAKYPQYRRLLDDDELKGPEIGYEDRQCVRPVTVDEEWAERFGPNWPGPVWETHPETFDIARAVRPTENEHVVVDGWQLSGLCRRLDVDTLVYVGFMANVCLLHVPGAMIEMAKQFRYRCVVLRDCTVAHELIPTLPNQDLDQGGDTLHRVRPRLLDLIARVHSGLPGRSKWQYSSDELICIERFPKCHSPAGLAIPCVTAWLQLQREIPRRFTRETTRRSTTPNNGGNP